MRAVRSKDTEPEVALRRALYAEGVRGWRCHYSRLPGTPDIAWATRRVAVFVDGAFWHGHPSCYRPGRSTPDSNLGINERWEVAVNPLVPVNIPFGHTWRRQNSVRQGELRI